MWALYSATRHQTWTLVLSDHLDSVRGCEWVSSGGPRGYLTYHMVIRNSKAIRIPEKSHIKPAKFFNCTSILSCDFVLPVLNLYKVWLNSFLLYLGMRWTTLWSDLPKGGMPACLHEYWDRPVRFFQHTCSTANMLYREGNLLLDHNY